MKTTALLPLALSATLLAACTTPPVDEPEASSSEAALTGNGAPSGAHYNLNLIGVPKSKTADMTGNDGHRIFVPLTGSTKINLSEGPFEVLDANATDGS